MDKKQSMIEEIVSYVATTLIALSVFALLSGGAVFAIRFLLFAIRGIK